MADDVASIFANQRQPQGIGTMSMDQLLNLAKSAGQFGSDQAAGKLLRESMDPQSGQFDATKALKSLQQPGPHQYGIAKHIGDIQSLATAGQALANAQRQIVTDTLGSITDDPSDGAIDRAVLMASHALRGAGINMKPSEFKAQFMPNLPADMKARKRYLNDLAKVARGSAATSAGTAGPPDPATGQPTQIAEGQAQDMRRNIAPQGVAAPSPQQDRAPGSGMPSAMPPGFETAATANVGAAQALHSAADVVPMQNGMLQNLLELSPKSGTGPTAEFEKSFNQLWQRFFPGSNATWTPEQLKSSEEFAKIAEQIAGAQASSAHATDAYLKNAYGANPNLAMSKMGREAVIKMLQGNNDAIEATRTAWLDYKNGLVDGRPHADNEYRDWLHKFYRGVDPKTGRPNPAMRFDPRVFQYMRLTPDERKQFSSYMSDKERAEFAARVEHAGKQGWISLPSGE